MKTFHLSLILGLNAIISHAAPSPTQPEARQTTTLSLDCTGATGSYQVEIALPSQENFSNFNIMFNAYRVRESFLSSIPTSVVTNPLSVSNCCLGGPGSCDLNGVEGDDFNVNGGYCVDVGPPQALTGGVCSTF